jgi:uncharacterized membrane protein YphA (DoxX/SURF4 family)
LTDVEPVGCVLATTTSTLVLIYHTTTGVANRRLQVAYTQLSYIGNFVFVVVRFYSKNLIAA